MKRLIVNNFLYYFKSKTKVYISIAFILSFFVMLFVYDNLELTEIKKEAAYYRNTSHDYYPENFEFTFIEGVDHDAMIDLIHKVYIAHGDTAYLLSGGRLNYELTPQRQYLNNAFIELYDLVKEEHIAMFPSFPDIEIERIEQERYESLMTHLIPDDFNSYTVTASNSFSRIFEGSFLLMILGFCLLLFYDLFAKDFDSKTYRHLYTTTYSRSQIILSKLLFAILYLSFLLIIGTVLLLIYLMFIKRNSYNVVPSRVGDLRHLKLVNTNVFSTFTQTLTYGLISNLSLNILSFITGLSMILLWIVSISYLSFKLKSSNNSLIVGVYALIALFAINLTPVKDLFTLIIPLFGFEYRSSLYLESTIHPSYLIVLCLIYTSIILYLLLRHVNAMDLLDGDNND